MFKDALVQKLSHSKSRKDKNLANYLNIDSPLNYLKYYCHNVMAPLYLNLAAKANISTILTLGDGYGVEGRTLRKYFSNSEIIVSDLDLTTLNKLKDAGCLDKFKCQEIDMYDINSYPDNCDLICVKESLHHLAKPHLAIYNMIDKTNDLICIVEPNGESCYKIGNERYETVGNYKYQFLHKEFTQICAAQGVYDVAIGYLPNMIYIANTYAWKKMSPDLWQNAKTRPNPSDLIINICSQLSDFCRSNPDWKKEINDEIYRWSTENRDANFRERFPWVIFLASKKRSLKNALKNTDLEAFFKHVSLVENPYN